jgi:hypothetical protein
LKKLTK